MQKKILKIFLCIVCVLAFTICFSNSVFATTSDFASTSTKDNGIFDLNRFDGEGNEKVNNTIQDVMGVGIQVTRIVATGVSIIMITYIGIKYMMAAPSERADMKKSAAIFIVGAVLVFAAGNILTIIGSVIGSNSQTEEENVKVNGDKSGKAIIYTIENNVYTI